MAGASHIRRTACEGIAAAQKLTGGAQLSSSTALRRWRDQERRVGASVAWIASRLDPGAARVKEVRGGTRRRASTGAQR
jgi:hypothetical protein